MGSGKTAQNVAEVVPTASCSPPKQINPSQGSLIVVTSVGSLSTPPLKAPNVHNHR